MRQNLPNLDLQISPIGKSIRPDPPNKQKKSANKANAIKEATIAA